MTDYPTYWDKRVTIETIVTSRTFGGLHPKMQDRVRRLIEGSGGRVGLGQGLRDPKQQLQMFLDRHVLDASGDITYDGQRWRRLPGKAPAAPPGRSMHEIGLAADMTGDMGWVRRSGSVRPTDIREGQQRAVARPADRASPGPLVVSSQSDLGAPAMGRPARRGDPDRIRRFDLGRRVVRAAHAHVASSSGRQRPCR